VLALLGLPESDTDPGVGAPLVTGAAAVASLCVVAFEVATAVGEPSKEKLPPDGREEAGRGEVHRESFVRDFSDGGRGAACAVSDAEAFDGEVELLAPSGKSDTADGCSAIAAAATTRGCTTAMVGAPSTAARRPIEDDEPVLRACGGTEHG